MTADAAYPAEGDPLIRPSTQDHPLYDSVVEACRTVYDPEIPVNIYDLGLVYTIEIDDQNEVSLIMTLNAPGCPVAISPLPGIKTVDVQMTFDPPWGMDMMSEEARLELGFM
jgi:metal-sulfur cluster biosynthetic enzyme